MQRHQGPGHLEGGKGQRGGAARRRGTLHRLSRDKRGVVAVIAALVTPGVLGVAGLAVEVGGWYLVRRNMQSAADAAAIAGALKLDNSSTQDAIRTLARGVTARNGFTHNGTSTTVDVTYAGGTGDVTVTVAQERTVGLLHAAGLSGVTKTVSARAVARVVDAGPRPCLHATTGSIDVHNNPSITALNCAIVTNSPDENAFSIGQGQGTIRAGSVVTHGGCNGCETAVSSGKLVLPTGVHPLAYAPVTPNPYASLSSSFTVPPNLNCKGIDTKGNNKNINLDPGCYTSLSVQPNATMRLKPGIYYIRGGSVDLKGTVIGTGVSIVLIGNNGGPPGSIDLGAKGDMLLQAGTHAENPDLNGVLFYRHAPNASPGADDIKIDGNAALQFRGAVVAPTSGLKVRGNTASSDPTANACNVFIVGGASFNGNPDFKMGVGGCSDYGVKNAQARIPRLMQ